jgi:hypothetical protein
MRPRGHSTAAVNTRWLPTNNSATHNHHDGSIISTMTASACNNIDTRMAGAGRHTPFSAGVG